MKTFDEFLEESRKLRILRTAHYTSKENKDAILKSGFHPSPSTGTYHPEGSSRTVYTTPSSRVGRDYGHSRVDLAIMNPKVKTVNSYANYRNQKRDIVTNAESGEEVGQKIRQLSPIHQSRDAIAKGDKVVRVKDAHNAGATAGKGAYIMVDLDTANKSVSKNPQFIRANKPRRKVPKIKKQ
jgi:hypothetical protein